MDKSGAETMPTTTESPPAPSAFPRESVRRGRNRDHERRRVRRVEHGETSLSAQRRVGGVAIAKTHTGTRAGTCLAPTWRSSGTVGAAATDPTRSQSQAEQQPPRGGPALLPFVRGERLTPELGDARLRARKERRAAATGDDRRRARGMDRSGRCSRPRAPAGRRREKRAAVSSAASRVAWIPAVTTPLVPSTIREAAGDVAS